jgi:argininosuccinate lyase
MTSQLHKKGEAWSARFSEPMSELVKRYTSSVFFDKRLALVDIAGSLAHASMLAAQKIISADDLAAIERGMAQIKGEIERGEFEWQLDLEDVHLNIEARLTALIGDAGKRLHTGRSRNDQVATDIRLWLRGEIDRIGALLNDLRGALLDLAEQNADTIMPGFTHLQVAQPVTFGHHLLAYVEMFTRDAQRMRDCRTRVNRLPLGAAALAGTSYPIDRHAVAKTLGFDGICANSLDAVSDRDFAIEFTAASALVMTHVALLGRARAVDEPARRLHRHRRPLLHRQLDHAAEEEPRRARAGTRQDRPRQRPPDGAAHADEGPAARVQQGQPGRQGAAVRHGRHRRRHAAHLRRDGRGHHREAGRDARGRAAGLLHRDRPRRLPGEAGLPFRDAHEAVAHAVRICDDRGIDLADLTLDEMKQELPNVAHLIGDDVFGYLTLEGSVASRNHPGGTAPDQVRAAIKVARAALGE